MADPTRSSERARLAALHRYRVLDTPSEEAFDRITRLVARLFDVPIALVSLLDEERLWLKSRVGLEDREVARDGAFCAHDPDDEDVMVVEDALEDPRFADHPLVTGEPGIRFYAGAPLVTRDGYIVGSLCAMDTAPRAFGEADAATLADLAAMVVDALELRVAHGHQGEVLEGIADAFIALDGAWRFTYVNEQTVSVLGGPRDALLGTDVWATFPEAVGGAFYEHLHRAAEERARTTFEAYLPPLDAWFKVHAFPFEGGLSVYLSDITEEKRLCDELQLLSRAVQEANESVVITDAGIDEPSPRIAYVNPAFEAMAGYRAEEVIGRSPRFLQGPKTDRAVLDRLRDHMEAGTRFTGETVNYRKDGSPYTVRWSMAPVEDDEGTLHHWVSVQRDVTEQRAMEAALRDREQRFRMLFQDNPLPMWVYDLETLRFLDVNEAAVAKYGYAADDFLEMQITDIRPREEVERLRENLAEERPAIEHTKAWKHQLSDGRVIEVDITSHTITYEGRAAALVVAQDVTERRRVERALREREEYLAVTLDSIGDAVITTDTAGCVTDMNNMAEQLTGWNQDEARGRPLADVLTLHHAQTREPVESPVAEVLREGQITGLANHTVLTARDGTTYQIADSAAPIRTDTGELLGAVLVFRDVTAAYEREQAREVERQRFEMALIGGDLGLWDWDMNTDVVAYNERWAEMLGFTLDEVGATTAFFEERTHPDDHQRVYAAIEQHMRGEIPHIDLEIRMRHKDGAWCWILDRGRILEWNDDGTPSRMVGTHLDVTQRREREEALQESQQRLEMAVSGAELGLWDWNVATGEVVFNERWAEMLGYQLGELEGHVDTWATLLHPDDEPVVTELLQAHLQGETPLYRTTHRLRRKDGSWAWILDVGKVVERAEDGAPLRATGIHLDITERKHAEEELRRQRDLLSQTQKLAGGWELDVQTGGLHWTEEIYHIYERPLDYEPHVETGLSILLPSDRKRVRQALDRALNEEEPFDLEFQISTATGRARWVRVVGEAFTEDGKVVKLAGAIQDVTKRRQHEQALRASQRRLQALFDNALYAILMADDEGRYLEANPAASELLGYSQEQIIGRSVWDFTPAINRAEGRKLWEAFIEIGQQEGEYTLERQDGTPIQVDFRAVANILPGVHLSMVRDVTERKRQEQALIEAKEQAEEMSRLKSAFLANMSHEIRTPLTSVIGFAEVLAGMGLEPPADEFTNMIERGANRLLSTLNSVLDLSQLEARAMALCPEEVPVTLLVRDVTRGFVPQAMHAGVELVLKLPDAPATAHLDPSALERIASNLLSNAIKFTGPGGQVTVRLAETAEWVRLEVADTGVGIDRTFLPQLFEAFKQESTGDARRFEGAGLGLAITKELVELMGGTIEVESTKDEGTTFTVELPRTAGRGGEGRT